MPLPVFGLILTRPLILEGMVTYSVYAQRLPSGKYRVPTVGTLLPDAIESATPIAPSDVPEGFRALLP